MGFTQSIQIAALSMLLGSICFELTKKQRILDFLKEYNTNFFYLFFISSMSCWSLFRES